MHLNDPWAGQSEQSRHMNLEPRGQISVHVEGGGNCRSGFHKLIPSEIVPSAYNHFTCDGCKSKLTGHRWFCPQCKEDYCFKCRPKADCKSSCSQVSMRCDKNHTSTGVSEKHSAPLWGQTKWDVPVARDRATIKHDTAVAPESESESESDSSSNRHDEVAMHCADSWSTPAPWGTGFGGHSSKTNDTLDNVWAMQQGNAFYGKGTSGGGLKGQQGALPARKGASSACANTWSGIPLERKSVSSGHDAGHVGACNGFMGQHKYSSEQQKTCGSHYRCSTSDHNPFTEKDDFHTRKGSCIQQRSIQQQMKGHKGGTSDRQGHQQTPRRRDSAQSGRESPFFF